MSAIHNFFPFMSLLFLVVCDIGGYDFVSYSQPRSVAEKRTGVVCDIGGYDFVSYSQLMRIALSTPICCL